MNEREEYYAKEISIRLNDETSLNFYRFAIRKLGVDKCLQLASETMLIYREGKINSTRGQYFNWLVSEARKD